MNMSERIPQEELDAARRRLARRVGAIIVRVMADTDTDTEQLAARIGCSERRVRWFLHGLIDGQSGNTTLHFISDCLLAMGAELEFRCVPKSASSAPAEPA